MTVDRTKTHHTYKWWGYKIALNSQFQVVRIERLDHNPEDIVGELYVQGADADLLDRVFAILEWGKRAMLEALDQAFAVEYFDA